MLSKARDVFAKHFRNNIRTYFFLFMAFVAGVSAGAFTVNGLSTVQREELKYYFQGFLQLFENQKIDNVELLKVGLLDNLKIVGILWILGVTIIGVPFIFIIIGIRGFITGFSSGFVIGTLGRKGVVFTLMALLPKELLIIPCIISLGVSGINFSQNIIRKKSKHHATKGNLKTRFLAYCMVTLFLTCFIFIGVFLEAYIIPVFIRMITPMITS